MSDQFISYQGNQQMGMPPHDPSNKLLLAGAWSKYIKKSVMCISCRWSRQWSGRGCAENKRMAIFSGLTTHKHIAHYPAIPLIYILIENKSKYVHKKTDTRMLTPTLLIKSITKNNLNIFISTRWWKRKLWNIEGNSTHQ